MSKAFLDMRSKYIPVQSNYGYSRWIHWWKPDSPYYYPYVLVNIEQEGNDNIREKFELSNDVQLFRDSGGFQVITGTCKLNKWDSLTKQIKTGANKLFAFDTPPVKQIAPNVYSQIEGDEYYKILESNFKIALEQSNFLKEHFPERLKDFYFVLHAKDKLSLDFNMNLIKETCGDFKKDFGGVCYSIKKDNIFTFGEFCTHARINFEDKGIPAHFLGASGSFKMIYMIKERISTFDSTAVLYGLKRNVIYIPIATNRRISNPRDEPLFDKQYCDCPACSRPEYYPKEEYLYVVHNLYAKLRENLFLCGIKESKYNETVIDIYNLKDEKKEVFEYMDMIKKDGFEEAQHIYRHSISKESKSTQKSVWDMMT